MEFFFRKHFFPLSRFYLCHIFLILFLFENSEVVQCEWIHCLMISSQHQDEFWYDFGMAHTHTFSNQFTNWATTNRMAFFFLSFILNNKFHKSHYYHQVSECVCTRHMQPENSSNYMPRVKRSEKLKKKLNKINGKEMISYRLCELNRSL